MNNIEMLVACAVLVVIVGFLMFLWCLVGKAILMHEFGMTDAEAEKALFRGMQEMDRKINGL